MPDNPILYLVLAALCLVLVVYKSRRLRSWLPLLWIGPLFWYDLARLARRSRTSQLRFVYGIALLIWLYVLFSSRFPAYVHLSSMWSPGPRLSPHDMADFAEKLVAAVVAVQGAAVFVITPAYLANAIAEERERGTLDLVLTMPLADREIVLGKLFGRLAHMGMILLTGLPILALIRLWGGVDGAFLIAGFAITALTLLSVGSISMLCSVLAPNVLAAVTGSYAAVALLAVVSIGCPSGSALTFLSEFNRAAEASRSNQSATIAAGGGVPGGSSVTDDSTTLLLEMLVPPTALHLLVFALCTALSVSSLRGPGGKSEWMRAQYLTPVDQDNGSWGPFEEPELYVGRSPRYNTNLPRVPVCDPPLLWKEVYHGVLVFTGPLLPRWPARTWRLILVTLAFVAGAFIVLHVQFPASAREFTDGLNVVIRVITLGLAVIGGVCLGFRVVVSVCGERQQKTLEGLFLLPVERKEILWAKWWGSILRLRLFGFALIMTWTVGLVTGAIHPWAVLLLAGACAVYLAFLASLGLCLSLVNRNVLWANLSMALALLLVAAEALTSEVRLANLPVFYADWKESLFNIGFNPLRALWFCGFSWHELIEELLAKEPVLWPIYGSIFFGLLSVGLAAWVLWKLACLRFNRELEARRN